MESNTARLTEFIGGGKQGEQGMQGVFCVAVFFEIGIRNIQNPRSIGMESRQDVGREHLGTAR